MYFHPSVSYKKFLLKRMKDYLIAGFVFGCSFGFLAGYLLKTYGG